jgi:hypothetical protein
MANLRRVAINSYNLFLTKHNYFYPILLLVVKDELQLILKNTINSNNHD